MLSCLFPSISASYFAGLENNTLFLTYSLVAGSVPDLSNLHLQAPLQFTIVDDPVFEYFEDILIYSDDLLLVINVSLLKLIIFYFLFI